MSVSARGPSQIVRQDAYGPGERLRDERLREQPHRSVESRASGWYWLIVGGGSHNGNPYNGKVSYENVFAVGGKLAVFSFKEEAQSFLSSRVPGEGWWVKAFGAGELVSMLYGPCNGLGSVALDPPAEVEDPAVDDLIAVERKEFVELLVRREYPRGHPPSHDSLALDHSQLTVSTNPGSKTMNEDTSEYANSLPAFSAPVRNEQGAPVVEVHGEVDLAITPELLEAIGIAGSRMDGLPVAVVDLREAEFVDVYGVRNLLEQALGMRRLGGELRLVVPEEGPVARVFELLEIERVLDLYHELDLSAYDSAS